MKVIRFLFRFIPGIVFIFSGFVKAVDPLGFTYKFNDYFTAFHLDFLSGLALPLAMILSSFELLIGFLLIAGYCRKFAAWSLLLFMSAFTALTLVLALLNPVSDCGCFGDALVLTNWQTFFKNLILLPFAVLVFASRRKPALYGRWIHDGAIALVVFSLILLFSAANYRHLPLIDFRPFSIGTLISEKMEVPSDAPVDVYETTLIYREKASGREEVFTLENYPKDTASWEFVDARSILVSKGFEPEIHDFTISDSYDNDVTGDILGSEQPVLLMISYNLANAREGALEKAAGWDELASYSSDLSFYALTASTGETVRAVNAALGTELDFYSADEIMLKTVIRSNPGFVLLRDGVIIGKWAGRDFPAVDELKPEWREQISQIASQVEDFASEEDMEEFYFPEEEQAVLKVAPKVVSYLTTAEMQLHKWELVILFSLVLLALLVLLRFNRKDAVPAYNYKKG